MSPSLRLGALLGALLLIALPTRADTELARRIAALKRLVHGPGEGAARRPAPPPEPVCVRGAWWRDNERSVRLRTLQAIEDASIRFDVEAALIRSVIAEESDYDPDAVSHKGAMGLMQLMPGTARELGVVCPFDPRANVLGGTRYLSALRERLGSWERALAAYHAGPERVEHGRIPRETWRYVHRVLQRWRPVVVVWR